MPSVNNALIGALRVEASLDAGKFVDGARKIQKESKQTEATVKSSFSGIGASLKSGVAGFVGALSVGAFTTAINSALQYAGSLGEMAQQLGVTSRDLQTFRFMAGQVGVSQEQLETGLSKLTITLGKVAAGAEAPTKALAAIGITAKDLANVDTGTAFRMIADGLQKVEDRSQRAAVEVALFGKSGAMLDNMLAGGSDQINELSNAAERLGIVLSDEQIRKADQTADKLEALKTVLSANIAGVVADNADSIYKFADSIASMVAQIPDAIRQLKAFYANFLNFSADVTEKFDQAVESPLSRFNPLAAPFRGGTLHANRLANIQNDRAQANGMQQAARDEGIRAFLRAHDDGTIHGTRPRRTGGIDQFLAPRGGGGSHRSRAPRSSGSAPHDRSEDTTFQFQREQQQADMDILRAKQQLAGTSQQRAQLALQIIQLEHDSQDAEINDRVRRAERDKAEGRITEGALQEVETQAATLKEKNDALTRLKVQAFAEEQQQQKEQALTEAADQRYEFELDNLHAADQMATTAAEHRRIQLQILDLQYEQKRLDLEYTKKQAIRNGAADEQIANIQAQIDRLPAEKARDQAGVVNTTKNPMEEWAASIPQTSQEIIEALQKIEADGLDHLADALTNVITGTESLRDAFHQLAASILADLIKMTIKMFLFRALSSVFGGLGGGAGAASDGIGGYGNYASGVLSGSVPANGAFASGGFVSGKGTGTSDSIPAMLSNGEFVVNAKATKKFLPFLSKINMGAQHLAVGGMVVPKVSLGERISVSDDDHPAARPMVHQSFDLRGAVMTEDLLRQMDAKAQQAAHSGAEMGVSKMIDLNQRTFGKVFRS
jgi:lambda family phage tail tape measure protein